MQSLAKCPRMRQFHILRIVELRSSGVAILQGNDGATVAHQVSKLAHCSVPVSDTRIYPETFIRTDQVLCQICGSKRGAPRMLLCDICNKGFHTFCIEVPLPGVPLGKWQCDKHKVTFIHFFIQQIQMWLECCVQVAWYISDVPHVIM